jgi:hypothetical protein
VTLGHLTGSIGRQGATSVRLTWRVPPKTGRGRPLSASRGRTIAFAGLITWTDDRIAGIVGSLTEAVGWLTETRGRMTETRGLASETRGLVSGARGLAGETPGGARETHCLIAERRRRGAWTVGLLRGLAGRMIETRCQMTGCGGLLTWTAEPIARCGGRLA